jgi:hypothetical protein
MFAGGGVGDGGGGKSTGINESRIATARRNGRVELMRGEDRETHTCYRRRRRE